LFLLACAGFLHAQLLESAADANSKKAHALLDQMIAAFGGEKWLALTSWRSDGQLAKFDTHGRPELTMQPYWDFTRVVTDLHGTPHLEERMELGKKRDDVEFFLQRHTWERTYKGKIELPNDIANDYFSRRDHSLFAITRLWLPEPKTLYLSEGQSMVERHLADKITIVSAGNLSTTLELDTATHLPLRLTFRVSNALYGDKDEITEEYDDYHPVQGIPTAYRITRYKNGDEVRETYVTHVAYGNAADPLLYCVEQTGKPGKK
jgi:hypothetical protein